MNLNYQFNYENKVFFAMNVKYNSKLINDNDLKVFAICTAFNIPANQTGSRAKIKNILKGAKFDWCRLEA